MPGMDGTGPRGLGPMTGEGRGRCNPYSAGAGFAFAAGRPYAWGSPYEQQAGMAFAPYAPCGRIPYTPNVPLGWGRGMGRGFGRGMGRGRGRGWW